MYLKNGNPIGMFSDKESHLVIRRGEIVKCEKLTSNIKKRIRALGLIEVSESEYLAWLASQKPAKVNAESLPVEEDKTVETPVLEPEVKTEEPSPVVEEPLPVEEDKTPKKKLKKTLG